VDAPSPLAARLQSLNGIGQPFLAVLPLPGGAQHLGTTSPTESEDVWVVVPLHVCEQHVVPLLEPICLEGHLRGQHHRAEQVAHGSKVPGLVGGGRRHRLVEPGHALLDAAQPDLRQAHPTKGRQLEIRVPEPPPDFQSE
jgi:hypothetical protein